MMTVVVINYHHDHHIGICVQDFQSLKRQHGMGEMRKIMLNKGPEEGLGMSITVRDANSSSVPLLYCLTPYSVLFHLACPSSMYIISIYLSVLVALHEP